MRVADIMTSRLVTVELDDSLGQVKDIFEHSHFHHLLVVDEGKLVGIVTDRDLFKAISPNLGTQRYTQQDLATLNKRVHQVVTRHPITLGPEAPVSRALALFNSQPISCIPVVNGDGKPLGIVSWRDILKNLKRMFDAGGLDFQNDQNA